MLQSLIVSASLGALIGLIRQWAEQQDSPDAELNYAGLRTFMLWSLIGYTSAFISAEHHQATFLVAIALVGGHIFLQGLRDKQNVGIGLTTGAAALITLFLGALVYWQHLLFAVMLAALTMIVIGLKQFSHSWTRGFTKEDIHSTLRFVAVTGVILPLVPNQGFGPYQAINPYSLWWMVVLISGLGFAGYILMRWLGTGAGVILTGLVGGLASSTATTLAFSRESKTYPALSSSFALAIVMACTIMLGRVLILLVLIYPELLSTLWLPFLLMSVPGAIYALSVQLFKKAEPKPMEIPNLKNPLGLSIAIKFALIYGAISFLVKMFSESNLTEGLLALSFVSGLTDMDAIALSITQNLKEGGVGLELATRAIILAAIANTILKAGLVVALGSPALRKQILLAFGAMTLAGVGALFLI
ncbi:MgtC/SapB family protein [Coraliomargarita sp. W4R72]